MPNFKNDKEREDYYKKKHEEMIKNMQPIFVGMKTNQPKEEVKYIYHVPKELEEEIRRKMKAFSEGYTMTIEPIVIKLEKPNDT